jgi:hypothetical protein
MPRFSRNFWTNGWRSSARDSEFRRQGARNPHAGLDPVAQLPVIIDDIERDPGPAPFGAAEFGDAIAGHDRVGFFRREADQEPVIANTRRDMSIDQEAISAKHAPVRQAGRAVHLIEYALDQILIVGHVNRRRGSA